MDFNVLSAWSALAAALAAIVGLWWQSRLTRFSVSLDHLWRLEERLNSEQMLNSRRGAAQALVIGESSKELDAVLNFWESVGMLLRRGALDDELVWSAFGTLAINYWSASQDYIFAIRPRDPYVWDNFEYLAKRLLNFEAKKRRRKVAEVAPSKATISEWLAGERQVA